MPSGLQRYTRNSFSNLGFSMAAVLLSPPVLDVAFVAWLADTVRGSPGRRQPSLPSNATAPPRPAMHSMAAVTLELKYTRAGKRSPRTLPQAPASEPPSDHPRGSQAWALFCALRLAYVLFAACLPASNAFLVVHRWSAPGTAKDCRKECARGGRRRARRPGGLFDRFVAAFLYHLPLGEK